jgi:hypothetical protein
MSYFFIGLYILFALTAIFYIVFFSLLYYWHEKKATFVVVPLIFTFDFFAVGFLVVCIVSLVLQYAPSFIKLIAQ